MTTLADVVGEMIDPAAVVESTDISPEKLEQQRRAFDLHLARRTYDEIAAELGVSRATVGRLLSDYRRAYLQALESEPVLHRISKRLAVYESMTAAALKDADAATGDKARSLHRQSALRAMSQYDALALQTGVLPKEPDRLLQAIVRPEVAGEVERRDKRTHEQILADVDRLLHNARTI